MRRTALSACLAAATVLITLGSATPAHACESSGFPPSFGDLGDCVDRTVAYVLDQLP